MGKEKSERPRLDVRLGKEPLCGSRWWFTLVALDGGLRSVGRRHEGSGVSAELEEVWSSDRISCFLEE